MRRPKIPAVVLIAAAAASLVAALNLAAFAGDKSPETNSAAAGSITAEFTGIGGMVFQRGQPIEIRWILTGDGVRAFESNRWSECELFFSTNGKAWTRITPALSVTRRSYDWTIPNVITEEAVFGLQIGIEGEGEFYFFQSEPFKIGSKTAEAQSR